MNLVSSEEVLDVAEDGATVAKAIGRDGGRGGGSFPRRGEFQEIPRTVEESSGRGRGSYSRRGEFQQIPRTADGSRFFNLSDGTRIEYPPTITYPLHIFSKYFREEQEIFKEDWVNGTVTPGRGYGCRGGGYSGDKRRIQQLEQEVWELRSQASQQGLWGKNSIVQGEK